MSYGAFDAREGGENIDHGLSKGFEGKTDDTSFDHREGDRFEVVLLCEGKAVPAIVIIPLPA